MKFGFTVILACWLSVCSLNAQQKTDDSFGSLPPFTKWYQNPLGVSPLSLHTSNGIIVPAIAAGAILLFTDKDSLETRVSYYDNMGVSFGYYGSYSTVFQNEMGINYMLRKYLSAGVEFVQVYATDDVNNTFGMGIRPFFRFYPVNKENWKLYFQSGAGLMLFGDRFPKPSGYFGDSREGTRLNGCPKYGVGAEFKILNSWNISGGIWHVHFSNGDHPGFERNPGHDSNGFSIGVSYNI